MWGLAFLFYAKSYLYLTFLVNEIYLPYHTTFGGENLDCKLHVDLLSKGTYEVIEINLSQKCIKRSLDIDVKIDPQTGEMAIFLAA